MQGIKICLQLSMPKLKLSQFSFHLLCLIEYAVVWSYGEGDTQSSWQSHGEPACAAYDVDVTKTCPLTVPAINQPVDVQWTPG